MPATKDNRFAKNVRPKPPGPARTTVTASRLAPSIDPRAKVQPSGVSGLQERRRRRRVTVLPMYSAAVVRVLSQRGLTLEGHVLDISENGMAIELDSPIAVGQAVTVEFRVSGMGRITDDQWMEFVAAGEVVRQEEYEDFPGGPYKIGVRFARMATMSQAQIARFVATHPG